MFTANNVAKFFVDCYDIFVFVCRETRVDPGKSDVYGVNMRSEAAYPYSGYIGEDWPYYNGSETGSTCK